MADFANVAAATAAGYKYTTWNEIEGPNATSPFYYSRLEKIVRGAEQGEDDDEFQATASSLSQAGADAAVVAALNAERSDRYGFQEAGSLDMSGGSLGGGAEVVDQT